MNNNTIRELTPEEQNGWISVDNMPKDGTAIQRWHKLWKCPVSVKYKPGISTIASCVWVTCTLDVTWPEDAFEPYWQPLPAAPGETSINPLTEKIRQLREALLYEISDKEEDDIPECVKEALKLTANPPQ